VLIHESDSLGQIEGELEHATASCAILPRDLPAETLAFTRLFPVLLSLFVSCHIRFACIGIRSADR
jgi:hypothetical protein